MCTDSGLELKQKTNNNNMSQKGKTVKMNCEYMYSVSTRFLKVTIAMTKKCAITASCQFLAVENKLAARPSPFNC